MSGGLKAPVAQERELVDVATIQRQVEPRVFLHVVARDDGGAVAARERDGGRGGRDVELRPDAVPVGKHFGEEARRHARHLLALRQGEFMEHERPHDHGRLLRHAPASGARAVAARHDVEPPTALHELWVLHLVRRWPRIRLEDAGFFLESQNDRDCGAGLGRDDRRGAEDGCGVNVLGDEREGAVVVGEARAVEAALGEAEDAPFAFHGLEDADAETFLFRALVEGGVVADDVDDVVVGHGGDVDVADEIF